MKSYFLHRLVFPLIFERENSWTFFAFCVDGGGSISFPFCSHTVTVVLQDLQNVNCCSRTNKDTIQYGGQLLFRTTLWPQRGWLVCTLSDGHRIHWLNKTLKGFLFILLNLSSGTETFSFSTTPNHKYQLQLTFRWSSYVWLGNAATLPLLFTLDGTLQSCWGCKKILFVIYCLRNPIAGIISWLLCCFNQVP